MKINQTICLLTLGIVLVSTTGRAQTVPAGTVTPTTYPQGAVASDSVPASKSSRSQKRSAKRSRMDQNSRGNSGGTISTTATSQDSQYRESSSSNGTSINNSNTTNYNSNNVVTSPTGVGSTSATPPNPGDQAGTEATNGIGVSPSGSGGKPSNATKAAVAGARTTETPAVTAGSTSRNTSIGDFISSSPNYTTLQNALQSADLFETLKATGPYTVFAPANNAFKKLPASAQGGLLEGRNHDALKQLLSYHVVKGSVDAGELTRQIKAGNGKAQLQTLAGGTLTVQTGAGGRVLLTDEEGGTAYLEEADNYQSNGVVHGISAVLLPKPVTAIFR